jgi:hypothetical protein
MARLSPLADKHFNVLGRYHFTVTDAILRGELRPLRDPHALEEVSVHLFSQVRRRDAGAR